MGRFVPSEFHNRQRVLGIAELDENLRNVYASGDRPSINAVKGMPRANLTMDLDVERIGVPS